MLTARSFPFQFDQSDHKNTTSPLDFEIIPTLLNSNTNNEPSTSICTPILINPTQRKQYPNSKTPISSTTVPTAFVGGCFIPIPPGKVPPSPDALLIAATMGLSSRTPDEDDLYAELSKHTHPIQAFTMMQGSTAPFNTNSGDDNGTTGTIRTMLVDSHETVRIASGDGEIVSKVAKKKKNGLLKSLFGGNCDNKKKESSAPPPPPMLVYAVEERKKKRRDVMRYNTTTREEDGGTLTSMVASFPLYTAFQMMKTMPGKLMLLATTINSGNKDRKKKPSSSSSSSSNNNNTTTTASPTPMAMQGFTNLKDIQVYTIQDTTINYHIANFTNTNTTTIAMMPLFLSFRQANNIVQKHRRHMIRARLVTRRIQRMIQCARTEAMAAIVIGGVGGGRGGPPSFPSRGSGGGFGGGSDDEEAMEEPPEVTEMIQEMMSSVEDQFFTGAGGGGDEMGGGYPPSSSSFRGAGRSAPGGGGPVGRALATLVCGSVSLVARTGLVVGNVLDIIAANTPLLQRQFLLGSTTASHSNDGTENENGTTTIKEGAILPQVVQLSLSDVLHDIETHNQSEADMLIQQGRVRDREEYNKRIASAAVWMGLRMKLTVQSVMMTRGLVKAISEATASLMQSGSIMNSTNNGNGLAFPLPILQSIQNLAMEKNNYFGEDDPDLHYWLSLLSSDDDNNADGTSRNRGGGATLVSKQLLVLNEDGGGRVENVPSPGSTLMPTTMGNNNNNNNNTDSKTQDVLTLIEMSVMGLNGHGLYDCINTPPTTGTGTGSNAEERPPQDSVDENAIKSGKEDLKPTIHTTYNTKNKYRRVAEVLHELGASGGVEIQGLEVPPRAVDAMQVIRSMSGGNGLGERRKRRDMDRNGVKGKGVMIISDTRNWEIELDDGMKLLGIKCDDVGDGGA